MGGPPVGAGSYVDLGYFETNLTLSIFSGVNPVLRPALPATNASFPSGGNHSTLTHQSAGHSPSSTFDTWPFHYEHDGIDQNGNGTVDEGTNGFDDDGQHGVDDPEERETSPPYDAPLRGIQVRIRVYEPTSRQVREVSIHQSFVPD
jgi:hypothetical protein